MSRRPRAPIIERVTDAQIRLASLREACDAASGDWHELTKLWSIQNDIDWLLSVAEAADYAAHVLDLWLTDDEEFTEERVRDAISRVRAVRTDQP